jgi:hypothetical protein
VAGGVIGGVVAISILAFFIWWWRRKLHRKRRSTLLTPLDAVPSFDRNEKGGYIITRGSIGPTPVAENVKNVLGQNFRRFQGHLRNKTGGSAPSVNLDRGTSQFMDPKGTRGPANSGIVGSRVTTKDRFTDWWSRLTADMTFNWRLRAKPVATGNMTAGITQEKTPAVGAQPDFLTLLNMDDRELDREAQRRRASISRKNGSDGFLGGLNLNFGSSPGDNPFSDTNAIAHTSAKPAPLAIGGGQPLNPFSDANAIRDATMPPPKPSTYVADIRRSRGHSVSTSRQPSTLYYYTNRDSIYSAVGGGRGSVGAGDDDSNNFRNKFRSDPFDLERTISNNKNGGSVTSSTAGVAGSEASEAVPVRRPPGAHRARADSFTSKYSSGISLGDGWSDPGPDVGPAARSDRDRASPTQEWRERLEREQRMVVGNNETSSWDANMQGRRQSAGSQRSVGVGKAM